MADPNASRGPWCVICAAEVSKPNHRFQFTSYVDPVLKKKFISIAHFDGELYVGYNPICGEYCLGKAVTKWANG